MSGLGCSGRGVGEERRRGGDLGTRITRSTSLLPTPSDTTTSPAALADAALVPAAAAAVVAASAVAATAVVIAISATAAVADLVTASAAAACAVSCDPVSTASASPVSRSWGFSDGESGEVVAHRVPAGAAALSCHFVDAAAVVSAKPFAEAVPHAVALGHCP